MVLVLLSKMVIAVISIGIIIIVFLISIILFALIFNPANINNLIEMRQIAVAALSFLSLSIIFILFAFTLGIVFGGIGVIAGTIGLSLLTSFLNAYGILEEYLPINITDFNTGFSYVDLLIIILYYVTLILTSVFLIRRKEL